jgi:dienelactone hydrolase
MSLRQAPAWVALAALALAACQKTEEPLPAPQAAPKKTVVEGVMSGKAETDPAKLGEALVDRLSAGQFEDAYARFDSQMQAALPADKLALVWQSIVNKNGAYQGRDKTETLRHGKYDIALVHCRFKDLGVTAKVVFDRDRVSGLFFFPDSGKGEQLFQPADYVDPQAFQDLEVTVGSGVWQLPASLSMPTGPGPYPALVLVHGSGPQDRDETLGPNKPFRDLAWGLASQGVAVLRYEKRTKIHANRMAELKQTITTKGETVTDAALAVELLTRQAKIDPKRVFVLGHSLGGMLIPRIANLAHGAAGFVVLAGTSRPLEDVILEQYEYLFGLDGSLSDEEQQELVKLRAQIARVKDPKLAPAADASQLPLGVPAAYWLDLRGYRPAEAATRIDKPLLVLQGGRDYQVTQADYAGWQTALAGRANVTFKLYPKLNHLFVKGEAKSRPADYQVPGHVEVGVIGDIAEWIKTGKVP